MTPLHWDGLRLEGLQYTLTAISFDVLLPPVRPIGNSFRSHCTKRQIGIRRCAWCAPAITLKAQRRAHSWCWTVLWACTGQLITSTVLAICRTWHVFFFQIWSQLFRLLWSLVRITQGSALEGIGRCIYQRFIYSKIVHFTFYINAPQQEAFRPVTVLVGISISRDSSRKRRGEVADHRWFAWEIEQAVQW